MRDWKANEHALPRKIAFQQKYRQGKTGGDMVERCQMRRFGLIHHYESSPSVSPTQTLSDEGQHQRIERHALSFRPCRELHVHGAWQPGKDFAGG